MSTTLIPTLKDVARVAGVSSMTVSRVLNDKGNVSEKTRERVKSVASDLGYSINEVASSLARRRNGGPIAAGLPTVKPTQTTIGCAVGGPEKPSFIESGNRVDSFSGEIWKGVQEKAEAFGYELKPFWHNDPIYQRRGGLAGVLAEQGIQSCICFGFGPHEAFHLGQSDIECCWATRPPVGITGSFCDVDRFCAVSLAVSRLAESLFRRPALIYSNDTHPDAQTLLEAAFAGAVRKNLPQAAEAPSYHIEDNIEDESTAVNVRFWIKRNRPDVVMTTGREMVLYLIDRLAELGYRHIPVIDLELDEGMLRTDPEPESLVGAVHSGARLGEAAVEMLYSRLADPTRDRNRAPVSVTVSSRWHGFLR